METATTSRPDSSKKLDHFDEERTITNEDVYRKLVEIEGLLAGKSADLLHPRQVYTQYGITPQRLKKAVKAGKLAAQDVGCPVKGGGRSYRVKRADVEVVFKVLKARS
jgi:hypothetical protein